MKVFYRQRDNMETIKTPFGKMQVVDEFVIQDDDKVTFCQKARDKYNELDKDGWFDSRSNEPYWYAFPYNRAKFTLCISKSLGKVCFIDYRKEGKDNLFESKEFLFEYLLEAVEDFPRNTRAMYRFARRRHNDTGAVRKVSGQPYWVHPEGVAKIVMEHGGSDTEIKAAFCHDVLEDTGDSYDDLEEKFGEKVASIVKEVTNDKFEIARIGKEKYISEELCRLSPEALTVKLADMLYNMKDSPTESNYERMRKNIAFLMMNRQLNGIHLALAEEIMEV